MVPTPKLSYPLVYLIVLCCPCGFTAKTVNVTSKQSRRKEKSVKMNGMSIYSMRYTCVNLEHLPYLAFPVQQTCICNSLISYRPGTSSACAYGLLESSERLQTIRAPTYFTCDESHYRWTKWWLSPFLKNRPAKTGRREAVWQSTSSRHFPHPFPPSK